MSKNYVIIVAGGTGSRMNSQLPKQYLLLGERPVLMHTIEQFSIAGSAPEIIVVIHPTMHDTWNVLCSEHGFKVPHTVIYGGQTRFQSVKRGLEKIVEFEKEHLEKIVIAVHDAARPVIDVRLIDESFEQTRRLGATVLAVNSTNSVRFGTIDRNEAVNRDDVWIVQTPQTFRGDILHKAFKQNEHPSFTDDASVVEKLGYTINLIPGDYRNIKITYPEDIRVAQYYIESLALGSSTNDSE